jgi:hypothetical protein
MLSRAGKSTTNQYLAFQKIDQSAEDASPVRRKKENPESQSLTPGAPKGFA